MLIELNIRRNTLRYCALRAGYAGVGLALFDVSPLCRAGGISEGLGWEQSGGWASVRGLSETSGAIRCAIAPYGLVSQVMRPSQTFNEALAAV